VQASPYRHCNLRGVAVFSTNKWLFDAMLVYVQLRSGMITRPCSEMIRQVCDARCSFMKATKEFRDVVLACSFSLTPYGYPRLKARLLRHFHIMWMNDPTREVLHAVLTTFPEQFLAHLPKAPTYQA
jgi:hypothetical protein